MPEPLNYEPPGKTLSAVPSRLDIVVVGVRLLGIYALLRAVFSGKDLVFALIYGIRDQMVYLMALPIVLGAVAGVILLVLAVPLGRMILPRQAGRDAYEKGVANHRDLQSLAFAVLGLYLGVTALTGLGRGAVSFEMGVTSSFELWFNGVQFVLAVVLFLQGRGLARLWHKLRTAGTEPVEAEQTS